MLKYDIYVCGCVYIIKYVLDLDIYIYIYIYIHTYRLYNVLPFGSCCSRLYLVYLFHANG